ncbi:hypothetical protein [Rhodococcus sp. APC 3903]|uniref:hypothetical protein n=1 Tax=Rhodococcus sp. APC 3903 TaxID=3035193 RepID=UPI0025B33504|nr:hypothetical protein [Rhodococcus sp. APC 3903]MDN3460890.1 hypothetical protein [Rhodococcus sp. APC 3903]
MSPSSKSKPRKRTQQQERPPLEPAQFPELNGMFYNADPAEYLKMRIESLSLMLCSDDALRPGVLIDPTDRSRHTRSSRYTER